MKKEPTKSPNKETLHDRLDTLRCRLMKHYLNQEGQKEIGAYAIVTREQALQLAKEKSNFDNMQNYLQNRDKKWVLIGPCIDDLYFNHPMELRSILRWLCEKSARLSGYAKSYNPELAQLV